MDLREVDLLLQELAGVGFFCSGQAFMQVEHALHVRHHLLVISDVGRV